jgi:hypothetical protein
VRLLRAQSGAKGSEGSGDGYLSDISRNGGGFRLIRWRVSGADIVVQLEGQSTRRERLIVQEQ